jgi:hypothetical protein
VVESLVAKVVASVVHWPQELALTSAFRNQMEQLARVTSRGKKFVNFAD